MEISALESTLLEAFRKLPPEAASELSQLVQRLSALPSGNRVDWSDSWSEEDLRDFTVHSQRRLESSEDSL
jgi:hypothetical protein